MLCLFFEVLIIKVFVANYFSCDVVVLVLVYFPVFYIALFIYIYLIFPTQCTMPFSLSYVFRYMFEYTVLMLQKKLFVYAIHFCFCSFDIESIGRIMFLCLYFLMIHGL